MSERRFQIGRMDCPGCAREVQDALEKLDGVQSAQVDFLSCTLRLDGDAAFDALKTQVEALGKTITAEDIPPPSPLKSTGLRGFWRYLRGQPAARLTLWGGLLLMAAMAVDALQLGAGLAEPLYLLALAAAIKPIATSGLRTLRINRQFNINMLMTIAGCGALILGEYLEAALVISLFSIGEALEGYTADRARDSLRSLMALKPLTARRIQDASEQTIPVEELQIGDAIRVLPGEKIPMDGTVTAGGSHVNQSSITGESLPASKAAGDQVFAGTLNGEGALEIRVSRLVQDNTLSRIIQLLQNAQSQQAPSQRLIDQFARVYTPAVALAALAVALLPPLLLGQPFWGEAGWLYRALAMLVIACPCALVISTPVTVISAIASAARRGVLIKGGAYLEALANVQAVAFDKTGTLTSGQLKVTATHTDHCQENTEEDTAACQPCRQLTALAAAVEAQSTHPFAAAILASAQAQNLPYATARDVEMLAGQGIRGTVDGQRITIGSHSYFEGRFAHTQQLCTTARQIEAHGQSAVMLHDGEQVRGIFALADAPRRESQTVLAELRALGIDAVMLTGDNATVAHAVGAQIGVERIYAELLPQDKLAAVEKLQAQQPVAMIGDGINDSPALARAAVGIAMGAAGSAQAMESADIVLLADSLQPLPATIRLARHARHLIRQNIALAFSLKALVLLLALTGSVTMLAAVFADVGMSLAVTLNGMRALKK